MIKINNVYQYFVHKLHLQAFIKHCSFNEISYREHTYDVRQSDNCH